MECWNKEYTTTPGHVRSERGAELSPLLDRDVIDSMGTDVEVTCCLNRESFIHGVVTHHSLLDQLVI